MSKNQLFGFRQKKRLYFRIFFTLIWIISINYCSKSQKLSLTLEECIKIAQANNLEIRQSHLNEKEADLEKIYANHQIYPSLNANSILSYNIGRGIDPITNSYLSQAFLAQGLNLNTEMNLFSGYSNNYKKEISLMNYKTIKLETEQLKREIALMVTDIYLAILFNQENLHNATIIEKETENQMEKTKKLVVLGLKLKSEYSQLEAQLFQEKEKIVSFKGEIEKNLLDMKDVLMLKHDFELVIRIPKIEIRDLTKLMFNRKEDIITNSLYNNKSYQAFFFKEKTAQLQKEIAKSLKYPVLKIGGNISTNFSNRTKQVSGYQDTISHQIMIIDNFPKDVGIPTLLPVLENQSYFSQMKNNWGIGIWLKLNIPIYNNYSTKMQIQKAQINEESIKISKEKLEREITTKTLKAYTEINIAIAKNEAAQKSYDAQNELFTVLSKQFEAGKINIYDYQKAKTDFENAQNRLLASKYELIFKSKILDFYLGKVITFEYE